MVCFNRSIMRSYSYIISSYPSPWSWQNSIFTSLRVELKNYLTWNSRHYSHLGSPHEPGVSLELGVVGGAAEVSVSAKCNQSQLGGLHPCLTLCVPSCGTSSSSAETSRTAAALSKHMPYVVLDPQFPQKTFTGQHCRGQQCNRGIQKNLSLASHDLSILMEMPHY